MLILTQNVTYLYQYENVRLLSLMAWMNKHVSKEKLARYGFFYNFENDHVKCFSCEVVIGEWGVGDDPLIEHHIHSPNCNFLNLQNTNNVSVVNKHVLDTELKVFNESVHLQRARHPAFKEELARLKSYSDWPKSIKQTPEELSLAGFFYLGVGDEVKCFFCGGCLKDWELTDCTIEEHNTKFNDCLFIREHYEEIKIKQNRTNSVEATPQQIKTLTDFMNAHSELKDKKLGNSLDLYNKLWYNITEKLNSIEGPKKSVDTWKEISRTHISLPEGDRSYQDYEVPNKKYRTDYNHEDSNLSSEEIVINYNSNVSADQDFSNPTPIESNNRSLELEFELKKQKCENEHLKLELEKKERENQNLKQENLDLQLQQQQKLSI